MKIWLADLSYNTVTKSVDAFPLGIGMLGAYAQKNLRAAGPVEIELFRDPDELRDALERSAPDVLGVSNYMWNFRLSLEFLRFTKARYPSVLTLMGGPNFPLDFESQDQMLRDYSGILDIYVVGNTYEGEVAFLEVLQRFSDADKNRNILNQEIPGCLGLHPRTGAALRGAPVPRLRNLDDIPSPYLSGLMDKFFATGLFAKIQLVRGCPFGCTFCNSAVKSNNKAFRHGFERIKTELDYIVERVDHSSVLALADDNFGMYKEDEEVAQYLGQLIETYNWPRALRTTTGKNNPERVLRVQDLVKGRLSVTASVQSMDPGVLKTIDRSNIRLDVYERIQSEVNAKGHQTYADVIIGLPGETLETLQEGSERLLSLGVQALSASQLLLLPGSLLAKPEARAKYGFQTKFRLVANCIGDFGTGRIVAETEEVTYQTPDFDFQDYIEYRRFHLISQIFWSERIFEEAFALADSYGVGTVAMIRSLLGCFDQASPSLKDNFQAYIEGSRDELFDTPEACLEWANSAFEDLASGAVGGNILYIAMVRARLHLITETIEYLGIGLRNALAPCGADAEIGALLDYYRAICIGSPLAASMSATPVVHMTYDVDGWRRGGYVKPLSSYQLQYAQPHCAKTRDDFRDLVLNRVGVFGETSHGLARLVRSWHANSFRRELVSVDT